MSQYKLIFTNIGLAKKQNAELNNDYIEITKFAVGSGVIATLVPSMTALIHEEYRADINNVDTKNGVTVFDLIIPSTVGGFYIKEVALFDVDGDCICIGTVPITYKVNQDEGASKAIHLKVSSTSTNTENIVFNTDDSLVYATVSYVNNSVNTLRNEMLLELPKKVNVLDVKNGLTFSDTDKPLSALQGKILKQYIDAINTMLLSDNSTLDNIQEIVDFIEMHQVTLNTLGIGNIAGLQNALNAKLGVNDTAANAAKLIGKNWNWNGQGGQPDWLWGGSDGANMYVYNPSNFSVNYANSAENLTTPSGRYKHVGAWGNDSIGANGNILVNSAYRAERAYAANFADNAIGANQGWGYYSRSFDTVYTNPSNRSIAVQVVVDGYYGDCNLEINGAIVSRTYSNDNNRRTRDSIEGIVPPYGTYKVWRSAGTWNINIWAELR